MHGHAYEFTFAWSCAAIDRNYTSLGSDTEKCTAHPQCVLNKSTFEISAPIQVLLGKLFLIRNQSINNIFFHFEAHFTPSIIWDRHYQFGITFAVLIWLCSTAFRRRSFANAGRFQRSLMRIFVANYVCFEARLAWINSMRSVRQELLSRGAHYFISPLKTTDNVLTTIKQYNRIGHKLGNL